jgi:CBS domain-containing protein
MNGWVQQPGHSALSLGALMQPVPTVRPYETVGRAVRIMGETRMASLPVVDSRGMLLGAIAADRVRARLLHADRTDALDEPIRGYMEAPANVVAPTSSPAEAEQVLAESRSDAAFVADRAGFLMGMVRWHDLVAPYAATRAPIGAGGMATPFGIYLTAGGVQAGVSAGGLIVGGIVLGLMIAASHLLVGAGCWGADAAWGSGALEVWGRATPPADTGPAALWLGLQAVAGALFLLILRASPLTGNHGAEHQVVHAMERGEPLTPEVVSRMPRVHARCGTNLIAAVVVFAALMQVFAALRPFGLDVVAGSLVGAVVAARTWRWVGGFLQQHFTTRPPSRKQLERAIEAAAELRERYARGAQGRVSPLRRLWCMGAPQTALGVFMGTAGPLVLVEALLGSLTLGSWIGG